MNRNIEESETLQENLKSIIKQILREELNVFKQEIFEQLGTSNQLNFDIENYHSNELLKPGQAAPLLKITTKTLGRWRKKGAIPSTLIKGHYFYRYKDIQTIIESQPSLDYTFSKVDMESPNPGRPSLLKTMLN